MLFRFVLIASLSSLGVKVLDSEEIEKNVIEQAVSLSEQQTPEFNELKNAGVH